MFEVKLLIVGKGDVGKTTLMKVLQNPHYKFEVGQESTTPGINIENSYEPIMFPAKKPYYDKYEDFDDLYFQEYYEEDIESEGLENIADDEMSIASYMHISEFSLEDGFLADLRIIDEPVYEISHLYLKKDIKINIWDFGGQEILYSTHQFFLTQRSLYIFVWEPRTDNEEESFDYWLNIIKKLSNDSPVLIVMNKAEIRIKNINELRYREKFNNIVGFYKVSCYNKEGIQTLINKLKSTISKLPQIGDILPASWNNIRTEIKRKKKDYISYKEFKEICNLSDNKKTEYLGAYLNDLGDIIHFKDDHRLKDFVIINPHWLTKAIYELINSTEIQKRNGLFDVNDLSKYLNGKKYPEEKHYEILMLMEKFEICFKILGSNNFYIIPSLLQAIPPDIKLVNDFKIPESLKFEIKYNFMPSGLIERLICRLNGYIERDNFWKYGSIFNTEYNKALVTINKVENTINLFVLGKVRSDIYNIIIHELHQIHKDLKLNTSDYEEKLACNCIHCSTSISPYMFERKTLLKFLDKSKYNIDCHSSTDSVVIEELLSGYKSMQSKSSFLRDFVKAFSQLQSNHKLLQSFDEDEINTQFQTYLRPYLIGKNYFTNEQSRKGESETGKKTGELDIVIETIEGTSITFYEGFILNSFNSSVIGKHIKKSLKAYDPTGLKEKYIGVYCKAANFVSLTKKYTDFIEQIEIDEINIIETSDLSETYVNASEMKVFRTIYERNESNLTLYHILANINF